MEIKLRVEEGLKIVYDKCPRCNHGFNSRSRKKTEHHILPKFLKPKTEVTITICKACHEELNSCYNNLKIKISKNKILVPCETFEEFKGNYEVLRESFNKKQINRGQFGEGLWDNLTNYLESLDRNTAK